MCSTEVEATQLPTEKALKEKKRKLVETLERIISFYKKEDPEKCTEIKKLIAESELRRRENVERCQTYQAARSQYALSDIPLPDANDIPMPAELDALPDTVVPPGPPPGPPPADLLAVLGLIGIEMEKKTTKSVRFAPEVVQDKSDDVDEESRSETVLRPPPPPPGMPPVQPLFPPSRMGALPPPPPGLPPPPNNFLLVPNTPRVQQQPHIQSQPVLKAPASEETIGSATISAQPQIRNIQAEVTKFMPTSLKVRRDQPKAIRKKLPTKTQGISSVSSQYTSSRAMQDETGDAYDAFMKEMDGLL